MITSDDYFRAYADHPAITPLIRASAESMLAAVNDLLVWAYEHGWKPRKNPHTGTLVSGQDNGGWRPPDCPIGAAKSAHKQGRAVDIYDPDGALDKLISEYDSANGLQNTVLEQFDLYREHPGATSGWCHLSDRPTSDGRRNFWP